MKIDTVLEFSVGAYPCGTIVLFDELYGSEGMAPDLWDPHQPYLLDLVTGILCLNFYKMIPVTWKLFQITQKRSEQKNLTKKFAQLSKHVDRFHF